MAKKKLPVPTDYAELLDDLKKRIRAAQMRAALSVNRELVLLYWHIGREILTGSGEPDGAPRSSTSSGRTCAMSSPTWPDSPCETSSTCGVSPTPGRTSKLCSRLLHKSLGSTIACSSIGSNQITQALPANLAGQLPTVEQLEAELDKATGDDGR